MGRRGPGAKPTAATIASPSKRKSKPKWQRAGLSRAERVIAFVETLKITSGMHAGRPMQLRDWQKDIIRAIYDPTGADGLRIVRQVLLTMARKNGKTQLAAALALAHLVGPDPRRRHRDRPRLPAAFFLTLKPCLIRNFDNDAGCATTPCSVTSLAANSGMVMSPFSSTQRTRVAAYGASFPPPGGRPCREGATEPVADTRCAIRTLVLVLIPKRRAAPRREVPSSIAP